MSFEKIKKNFGFGCMRLKMLDDKVDYAELNRMIDMFMEAGFNYFDTAHGYIGGKSEKAIRDCLAARYKREDFVLANKLSSWFFENEEDVEPLFESQLALCGVEYFDFYLFHTLTKDIYAKHKRCNTFEIVKRLKEQGKIRHIAMSFHDTADVLDTILTEQPCIEAVQLQFNYLDYDDPDVQSKACYDVAVKHGKRVMVMEPVRGGALAALPEKARMALGGINRGSDASFALRFAASFPAVFMVLSGMGSIEMMQDNINTFSDFVPFSDVEFEAAHLVRKIIREVRQIPCTGCRYCTEVCPKGIAIPEIFAVYNKHLAANITEAEAQAAFPTEHPVTDCIQCGACESICPQGISIKNHMHDISKW